MRFNVLVALFVATFVASCGSFISAETDALDDNIYNSNEVARRLRGDNEVQEERGPPGMVGQGAEGMDDAALATAASLTAKDLEGMFKPKDIAKLSKNGVTVEGIVESNPAMIQKLTEMAIKGSKGKEGWFKKSIKFGLMAAGVIGLLYVLYCWGFKAAPNTTADSTAKRGTTTPASA